MTAPSWMPLYIADYLADTGHLSTVEHGAYLLLIMHYWQHGGIPDDDAKLARICRMQAKPWAAIRDNIADLFDLGWRHKRVDAELATASETMTKRSAAGRAGASARYANRSADAMATAQQSNAPTPTPTPTPEEERKRGADAPATYAFSGRIIRLKAADFDRWKASYSHIPDLMAALQKADSYYSEHPPPDGKWFFPVSKWLERENSDALAKKAKAGKPPELTLKVAL